jgi:NAD-dependent dihydropyrimidine dehydrogenase PreA subunit
LKGWKIPTDKPPSDKRVLVIGAGPSGLSAAYPEEAIVKLGPTKGYEIKLDLCTGCMVCVEQCPCHAMEMVQEPGGIWS